MKFTTRSADYFEELGRDCCRVSQKHDFGSASEGAIRFCDVGEEADICLQLISTQQIYGTQAENLKWRKGKIRE